MIETFWEGRGKWKEKRKERVGERRKKGFMWEGRRKYRKKKSRKKEKEGKK